MLKDKFPSFILRLGVMVRTALAVDCGLSVSEAIEMIIELLVCQCHLVGRFFFFISWFMDPPTQIFAF